MSLQPYLFVLFAGMMLLLDQTLGKPLKSQELEQRDHNIKKGGLESSQAVNGTSQIRGKRGFSDCSVFLKDLCTGQNNVYLSPGNDCEIGRYMCLGFSEAVCKKTFSWAMSAACNRNIWTVGKPDCTEVWESVTLSTGECVQRASHCSC